jgi:hypothetical protein
MWRRTRQVIQLDHIDGTEFSSHPNDGSRDEHDSYRTGKKVGCISYRHNGRVFVQIQQGFTGIVQWKSNGNLDDVQEINE